MIKNLLLSCFNNHVVSASGSFKGIRERVQEVIGEAQAKIFLKQLDSQALTSGKVHISLSNLCCLFLAGNNIRVRAETNIS